MKQETPLVCEQWAVPDRPSTDVYANIDMFLGNLAHKGRRDTTIRTYREALKSVFNTFSVNGMRIDPRMITGRDFELLRTLMTVCDNSKRLYLVVLGRFVEFLTGHNPRKGADLLWNEDDKRRKFINAEEFKVMMLDGSSEERLVLTLGAYMGLRRSEIASIRLGDIQDGHMVVRGKGHGPQGKVARLFIPVQVRQAISDYMCVRRSITAHSGSTDDHLLLRDTRKGSGRAMDPSYIAAIVSRVSKRNGVDMTPHSLRRLYATTLYEGKTDLNTLRLMMRHSDVSTTMNCYINVSQVRFEEARNVLTRTLG